jgi:hypothetical protein
MKILDKEVHLYENIEQSINQYKVFWLIFIISIILDTVSTYFFMKIDGIGTEANVLIKNLAYFLGIIPGVIIGKSLQFIAAIIFTSLSLKYSRAILLLFTALNLLASFHNFSSIY